jgi:aminoglycoside phosphotransferase (APT) family kinase protein
MTLSGGYENMSRDQCETIRAYLKKSGWVTTPCKISFLASGEYNENYMVAAGTHRFVFRINHGSQLGLKDQIGYEFNVLKALEKSGVTPRPCACDPEPEAFGAGVLLMEYVPGVPLKYETDMATAAEIFARIHTQPLQPGLIRQADPIAAIAEESIALVHRYADHPRTREKARLVHYHGQILDLANKNAGIFTNEPLCIVNTEVNSGNFCINVDRSYLVDWEKAVISSRYQDLGHFLVPTTTLWKTDHICSLAEQREFLTAYQRFSGLALDKEEVLFKTQLLMQTIALRATAWCFMAWYEYTRQERSLNHSDTFERICYYLDNLEWIFDSVA